MNLQELIYSEHLNICKVEAIIKCTGFLYKKTHLSQVQNRQKIKGFLHFYISN